jgi:hypothetical protein
VRTFDPQAQLAGSVANSTSTIWLRDAQTLQMNSIMKAYCGMEKHARKRALAS